jgi:two-component system, cell cycle response regulator
LKIVVVDSSRVVLRILGRLLEPKGHSVVAFTDSREALNFVREDEDVEAVITSLETRPLGGIELCWSLRLIANANRPLCIIAMSSLANSRNLSEALDSGADDFISKPPIPEELHARLRAGQRLTMMQQELIRLAENDVLTGLLNRRAFLGRLNALREAHGESERHVPALILADIDNFKYLNDNFGHDIGDEALRRTGAVFADEADAEEGIAARFGGEEFVIALPGRSGEDAMEIADRLRRAVSRIAIECDSGTVRFTSSFGVGEWHPKEPLESVFKRADTALYRAKKSGRDRVVTATRY